MTHLWRGPFNIYGFVLDGKSYQQGQATALTSTVLAASGVSVIRPIQWACSLVTDKAKWPSALALPTKTPAFQQGREIPKEAEATGARNRKTNNLREYKKKKI